MASSTTWALPRTSASDWTVRTGSAVTPVRQDTAPIADPSLEGLGDAELVAACLSGRAGAFDLIVERHRRAIYQLCYRFVGNHEDASDLSQDVFLRAYRGLRSFRGGSSFGTWLYRIGVNVCLNRVSAKSPAVEPIEERQFVDERAESPSER